MATPWLTSNSLSIRTEGLDSLQTATDAGNAAVGQSTFSPGAERQRDFGNTLGP